MWEFITANGIFFTQGRIWIYFFKKLELIPAVIQEKDTKIGVYASLYEPGLQKTLETGYTWFYSRSRQ